MVWASILLTSNATISHEENRYFCFFLQCPEHHSTAKNAWFCCTSSRLHTRVTMTTDCVIWLSSFGHKEKLAGSCSRSACYTDPRVSWAGILKLRSSTMWRCVVSQAGTNVSDKTPASIFWNTAGCTITTALRWWRHGKEGFEVPKGTELILKNQRVLSSGTWRRVVS
jgi:hypothetical protein